MKKIVFSLMAVLVVFSFTGADVFTKEIATQSSCQNYDQAIRVGVGYSTTGIFGKPGTIVPLYGWPDLYDLRINSHGTYDSATVIGKREGTGCVQTKAADGSYYYYKIKVVEY